MEKLVTRAMRKLFYGVPASNASADPTFTRMKGFSSLSESKTPSEYSVKYVDMEMETTTVIGMNSSYDFTFDRLTPSTVHDDMTAIIDDEKIGSDAVRTFVSVDFATKNDDGTFPAVKRDYTIVASSIGGSTDSLSYSGNLKALTPPVKCKATISLPASGGDYSNVQQVTVSTGE